MASKYAKFDWKTKKQEIKKEEEEKKNQFGDPRFWKFKYDKNTKKGTALLRFLPDKNQVPYKQYFSHWFDYEGPSGNARYTEKCATSVGGNCPVCERNRELFNSIHEVDNNAGRERKRRYHYVANILVLKDPVNPDNENKVFLFDFGPQIFSKYKEEMFGPEDEEEDEINEDELYVPCDFMEGADFLLKSSLKKGTKWITYEPSKFKDQSQIFNDLADDEWGDAVDNLMDKTFLLDEWSNPENYPSKETVFSKLAYILESGVNGTPIVDASSEDTSDDPEMGSVIEPESELESDEDMITRLVNE